MEPGANYISPSNFHFELYISERTVMESTELQHIGSYSVSFRATPRQLVRNNELT
jgi:hypothetical protein